MNKLDILVYSNLYIALFFTIWHTGSLKMALIIHIMFFVLVVFLGLCFFIMYKLGIL